MCGIAGILGREGKSPFPLDASCLRMMGAALAHRGPDGEGIWLDETAGVGLAHRRLSILDLSPAGTQPMVSATGRYVIAFNGEIYNHCDLRIALERQTDQIEWRGHSDTETLLTAIEVWGLVVATQKACGMFAFALWDREEERLSLVRDRTGEKPLYLLETATGWAFASEPAGIFALPDIAPKPNAHALSAYLATSVVPDKACAFEEMRKVRPGTILHLSPRNGTIAEEVYCDLVDLMARQRPKASGPGKTEERETKEAVERVLTEVVASQMISDVPLGSFLSGGVDSSLVTALMQAVSDRPVKTFSIGFDDAGYDESAHAERVAAYLETEHTTFRVTEDDALELIPNLPRIYGEPFADSSQIPTALLCAKARQAVTVALTGDGGDEVFGGYNRHVLAPKLWARLERLPRSLRRVAAPLGATVEALGGSEHPLLRGLAARVGLSASMLNKAGRLGHLAAHATSLDDVYIGLTRSMDEPQRLLRESVPVHEASGSVARLDAFSPEERIIAYDTMGYLPSDILVKVDRAAMHASLETRAPFLDIRTLEAAWSVPLRDKIRNRKGKQILRELLDRHVPRDLIERPKQGFAVPIDRWLRGDLREWAEDLLSPDNLREGGLLRSDAVRDLWQAHLTKRGNHGQTLWSILMLQTWLREWNLAGPEARSQVASA